MRRFESRLLPAENKPLEMSVLKRVKELLAEVDARTAAKHITMVDCRVGPPQEASDTSAPQRRQSANRAYLLLDRWLGSWASARRCRE